MLTYFIHVLITAFSVMLAAKLVPGLHVRSFEGALVFAFALAILNSLFYKLMIILSLPFIVVSFGLFIWVINAFLFWLADALTSGVHVQSIAAAMLGALLTSAISTLMRWLLP